MLAVISLIRWPSELRCYINIRMREATAAEDGRQARVGFLHLQEEGIQSMVGKKSDYGTPANKRSEQSNNVQTFDLPRLCTSLTKK